MNAVESIEAQADGRPMEILAVDDRSADASRSILEELADAGRIRLIAGPGRGAAAAVNVGLAVARFPIVCQVDQDVELQPRWMSRLVRALERDPGVAAAQGYYETDPRASMFARVTALDLELRYAATDERDMEHACTGNTAYRAKALAEVGGFDETLGYGYDNDMSYRLRAAGHRLVMCRAARSRHRWREGLRGYCRQQYGLGYGRLDLVAKHPRRLGGDSVSPSLMMAHPPVTLAALTGLASGVALRLSGGDGRLAAAVGAALLALLAAERTVAGVRAAVRFTDAAALWFPLVHLVRDLSWVTAVLVWSMRRLVRRPARPSDSMRPRQADAGVPAAGRGVKVPSRVLGIVPAHNEAATLPAVVSEIRLMVSPPRFVGGG